MSDSLFQGKHLNLVSNIDDGYILPYLMYVGCTNLVNITIPTSTLTVSSLAFTSSGLTSVVLPTSITFLDQVRRT